MLLSPAFPLFHNIMTNHVQDHIHLALSLGTAPENSPIHKWNVRLGSRLQVPKIYVTVDEALNGAIQLQQLLDNTGDVVRKSDYKFVVKCADDDEVGVDAWGRLDDLLYMNGKRVHFVDSYHVNDGEDHTLNILPAILFVGEVPDFDPKLTRFYVPIQLLDDHIT